MASVKSLAQELSNENDTPIQTLGCEPTAFRTQGEMPIQRYKLQSAAIQMCLCLVYNTLLRFYRLHQLCLITNSSDDNEYVTRNFTELSHTWLEIKIIPEIKVNLKRCVLIMRARLYIAKGTTWNPRLHVYFRRIERLLHVVLEHSDYSITNRCYAEKGNPAVECMPACK